MPMISLIAPDGMLDATLAVSLRNAWGGGDVVWLSADEAAEFHVDAVPANFWDTWESLQAMSVDLVLQPDGARRKKLLIADMDSTMIGQECIDELADVAGVGDRVKEITARAMNGELDFVQALDERVGLLKGQPVSIIAQVISDRITFTAGGPVLLATMKADGAYGALVSGGFTAFTGHVAGALGFDEHRANTLLHDGDVLSGKAGRPVLGQQAKVDALAEITARLGISENDALAVGDGANDLGMLGRAGLGVALHAKPAVAAQCEVRINHGDLSALLFLQGYSRDQFVTP
ncbi:MAG: phosphoserine phosphatase SerB [Pseudomonadota bacterium]